MMQSFFYLLLLLALPVLLLYFAPTIVAISRGGRYALPIFALNVLVGWTLIGWLLLLAWAIVDTPATEAEAAPKARKTHHKETIVDAEVIDRKAE